MGRTSFLQIVFIGLALAFAADADDLNCSPAAQVADAGYSVVAQRVAQKRYEVTISAATIGGPRPVFSGEAELKVERSQQGCRYVLRGHGLAVWLRPGLTDVLEQVNGRPVGLFRELNCNASSALHQDLQGCY